MSSETAPLTYRPFEAVPRLDELRDDLYHNVPPVERIVSVAAGSLLLLSSLRSRFSGGLVLASAGLLLRGMTGHCAVYQWAGLNRGGSRAGEQKAA